MFSCREMYFATFYFHINLFEYWFIGLLHVSVLKKEHEISFSQFVMAT